MSDTTYVNIASGDITYVTLASDTSSITISTEQATKILTTGLTGPQGIQGIQGDSSTWVVITQAGYDAITPDPDILYIIIG